MPIDFSVYLLQVEDDEDAEKVTADSGNQNDDNNNNIALDADGLNNVHVHCQSYLSNSVETRDSWLETNNNGMLLSLDTFYQLTAPGAEQLQVATRTVEEPAQEKMIPVETLSKFLRSTARISTCEHCFGQKTKSLPSYVGLGKVRRKVSFADDYGIPLNTVRVFQQDPKEMNPILLTVVGNDEDKTNNSYDLAPEDNSDQKKCSFVEILVKNKKTRQLSLTFEQPISDFYSFLSKIETCQVSLENVVVSGNEFWGMVRVKNIDFEKEVFARYTSDDWRSHSDVINTYVPRRDASEASAYDTFTFRISVDPDTASQVEFVLCYRVLNREYWDNNQGQNYKLFFT